MTRISECARATLTLLATLLALPAMAQDTGHVLSALQWESPRSGERVRHMAPLPEVVGQWMQAAATSRIALHYPGGEEGELWVQELADWLVALGVPSEAIVRLPGSGADDRIVLDIVPR